MQSTSPFLWLFPLLALLGGAGVSSAGDSQALKRGAAHLKKLSQEARADLVGKQTFEVQLVGKRIGQFDLAMALAEEGGVSVEWTRKTRVPNSPSSNESEGTTRLGPRLELLEARRRQTTTPDPEPGEAPEDAFPPSVRVRTVTRKGKDWSALSGPEAGPNELVVGAGPKPVVVKGVKGPVYGELGNLLVLGRVFSRARSGRYALPQIAWEEKKKKTKALRIRVTPAKDFVFRGRKTAGAVRVVLDEGEPILGIVMTFDSKGRLLDLSFGGLRYLALEK